MFRGVCFTVAGHVIHNNKSVLVFTGNLPLALRKRTRFSFELYTRIVPYPPSPDIIGSTTFRVEATAIAASYAFPPFANTFKPASVAKGCAEETPPVLLFACFSACKPVQAKRNKRQVVIFRSMGDKALITLIGNN